MKMLILAFIFIIVCEEGIGMDGQKRSTRFVSNNNKTTVDVVKIITISLNYYITKNIF